MAKSKTYSGSSIRLTDADRTNIAALLEAHPYLHDQSDAIRFALHQVTQNASPRCPDCGQPMTAKRVWDGGTLGVWACAECSDGCLPVTVDKKWFSENK